MNAKPSFSKSSAYCTVRAFMAALEILYEGAGMKCMNGASVVEPRVVELLIISALQLATMEGYAYMFATFFNLPFCKRGRNA